MEFLQQSYSRDFLRIDKVFKTLHYSMSSLLSFFVCFVLVTHLFVFEAYSLLCTQGSYLTCLVDHMILEIKLMLTICTSPYPLYYYCSGPFYPLLTERSWPFGQRIPCKFKWLFLTSRSHNIYALIPLLQVLWTLAIFLPFFSLFWEYRSCGGKK